MKKILIFLIFLSISCNNDDFKSKENIELPDWIIGSWSNSGNSNLKTYFNFEFEKNKIYFRNSLSSDKEDILKKHGDRNVFIEKKKKYLGLFFVNDIDTISYQFKSIAVLDDKEVLIWDVKLNDDRMGFYSSSMSSLLIKK